MAGLVAAGVVIGVPVRDAEAQSRRAAKRPDLAGLAVPPGSRPDRAAPGAWRSSRSLRRTVEFYKRLLRQRGLEFREIPTYQRRGVIVARLLADSPRTRWAAIHVWKSGSQTRIAIVPKTDLTSAE